MEPEISSLCANLAPTLEQVIPFVAFSPPIRRIVYTTNVIEAVNSKLRQAVRTRGHFPGDEAATKLLYLVLNRAVGEWKRPPHA
jgi:putative transposase